MMKPFLKFLSLALGCWWSSGLGTLGAQDAHFSQVGVHLSHSNPAKVGHFAGDFRLSGSFRTQWWAIPEAYQTYRAAFEHRPSQFSWGADIVSQQAGEASLKQQSLQLKGAFEKQLSDQDHYLRAGVALGVIQQRFDPEAFQFDNQYQAGLGFNANLATQENFENTNHGMTDLSAGLVFGHRLGNIKNEIGLGLNHLNRPPASFFGEESLTYPLRSFFHVTTTLPLLNQWAVIAHLQNNRQANARATLLGVTARKQVGPNKSFRFGLAGRLRDALILSFGLRLPQLELAISYDINQSKLAGATNGNGALEIGIAYYFEQGEAKPKPAAPAPKVVSPEPPPPTPAPVDAEDPAADSDGDGVPNGVDECPYIPGLWKYAGCNDRDQDGVYDRDDDCPNLYGDKLNRGCPSSALEDSDQDGLIDRVDECPFLKGPAKFNGCPDTDEDGLSDKLDRCPFLKGTVDNNGCPKVGEGIPSTGPAATPLPPRVHVEFDVDQHFIKAIYWEELDRAAQFLLEQPTLEVFISGHTDAEGNAAYNFELGNRRCEEVKRYLVDRGVSAQRISVISYGETKPIHTNNTVYGKARNRRAEIIWRR